jgi:hypothetical protein
MAALFPRRANSLSRLGLYGAMACAGALAMVPMIWVRTAWVTGVDQPVRQPIDFDHRHHVADAGIDCLYCHAGATRSAWAGVPSTATCMGCHAQIWNKSPVLEPLRRAWAEGKAIAWNRVYRLPDFVYFDHSIHLARGVDCVTCHGRVETMPAVRQATPLTMGWCLGCHRDPGPALRGAHPRVSCTTCHR